VLLAIFTLSIFLSAALLFMVQPMAGKILLPLLGGSPAVWNTCMVFFQGALLAGYGYSHLLTTRLSPRRQAIVHCVLLALAAATLPMPVDVGDPSGADPVGWLLTTLLLTVGLPFFVVSTTGPLLQRWFSTTTHVKASDPYFLYAASNAGSLTGLLAYPALVEPLLGRKAQTFAWAGGFVALAALVVACAVMGLRRHAETGETTTRAATPSPAADAVGWRRRLHWLMLAFVPSSLMLGVTQYITTDVAPVPLLWIVPLSLYLVTFIIAFSGRVNISAAGWGRALPLSLVTVMIAMLVGASNPMSVLATIHLAFFFIATMMCHKRMAETRPPASRLTEFYFIMSLGGVLGGCFNAILAPVAFDRLLEYPLVIGLACLMRPQVATEGEGLSGALRARRWAVAAVAALTLLAILLNIDAAMMSGNYKNIPLVGPFAFVEGDLVMGKDVVIPYVHVIGLLRAGLPVLLCVLLFHRRGNARFALGSCALLVGSTVIAEGGTTLYQARTFFGVNSVTLYREKIHVKLSHGTTIHGLQTRNYVPARDTIIPPPALDGKERFDLLFRTRRDDAWREANLTRLPLIPTTYYHPSSPIGDLFGMLTEQGRLRRVGLVGLGAGTLAAYAQPGSRFTFYEIDPAVVEIASPVPGDYAANRFTYIADAMRDKDVTIGYELGDGRLLMRRTPEGPFDLVVLDAFSSDSVPVHLLTRQAVQIYLDKLAEGGLIAFHISNRYFDLRTPLGRIAHELGLRVFVRSDNVVTKEQFAEGKKESLWLVMCRDPEDMGPLRNLPTWDRPGPERNFPLWTDDHANVLGALIPASGR
jgi:SAM-dependent methyltransferase